MGFKVCSEWRDIALTIRDRMFEDNEEQLIDVHDVEVNCFLPLCRLNWAKENTTTIITVIILFSFEFCPAEPLSVQLH